ncbi:putative ABC transport system permease protein [Diaminobutyricimonas aerilata]|uniref:Putative ABC transport system permease protein n=1 Tax=Diaminobutyricimonas aerilata TaxID=1162967 RepID=A0A2M9CG10_9MICO|nr:ABC transporter permease [Diaminobutyricimonas aerilata]PJJ70819.1 putative ABC transport system permease protein [Diaminobutyricimonas aerilata]
MTELTPARLRMSDILRTGSSGLRSRPTRVALSALGIAIGIAAMVAVVGISSSSRADLDRQLAALGTNLLRVAPGQTLFGEAAQLPEESTEMVARIGPVTDVSATGSIAADVYRSDLIPSTETGGISAVAAQLDLPETVGATIGEGTWLNAATARYPAVVLGATAAERLGIGSVDHHPQILIGGEWFTVVGILDPVPLAPELDPAALVGWPVADSELDFDGHPTTLYTRSADSAVESVQSVLAATANPEAPNEVDVSRPSDALAAQQATDRTFTALLLGLGAVALLVGGVGVANTMVISVLERRGEIGLRRSLGATRGHIRVQFLTESLLLSSIGGVTGVLLGAAVTAVYATVQGWPVSVPLWAATGGVVATLVTGAVAGLYPAARAARLSPTEALAVP